MSVWTLRKLAYLGDIASVKLGVKLLIPESELVRLIQEGLRPRRSAAARSTTSGQDVYKRQGLRGWRWEVFSWAFHLCPLGVVSHVLQSPASSTLFCSISA